MLLLNIAKHFLSRVSMAKHAERTQYCYDKYVSLSQSGIVSK